ncbi:unnamed protein product [Arctia plantaginis]|uniref:Uncharacterized protein n=1 Tax=Arctia plantaginis TaxID=874455 RepID=A0A8S1BP05_ARCPL|nr:unnamed protein product [Arctia plantaginis]CAB3258775.1 unnamed protein product [Arctia plantaginis]
MMSPFRSLYQGVRNKTDKRVFRRRFDYDAQDKGHQILCEGIFDCYITFLAIESSEAIPVLLRGGAGYRHFSAVVKARPGRELKGQVRAYCKNDDSEESLLQRSVRRSMKFKKSLIEQDVSRN